MGKKLSERENSNGMATLAEYVREHSCSEIMRVIAKKGNVVIFNDRVKVIVGNYNIYSKVDIFWDDVEPNYHDIGLFGYYSTSYNKVSYSNGALTIYSDGGVVITIVQ